jgi:hypothetical protein
VKRFRWRQINPFRDVPATLAQWRTIRRGWLKIVVFLVLAVGLISLPYLIARGDLQRPPIDEQLTTLPLPQSYTLDALQEAEVEEVIDGDTIDVLIDGILYRVRYFGVDTPERGRICYRESLDRNGQLIGDTVYLLPDARTEDEFGRTCSLRTARLWTPRWWRRASVRPGDRTGSTGMRSLRWRKKPRLPDVAAFGNSWRSDLTAAETLATT